jgi:hypothetical protein
MKRTAAGAAAFCALALLFLIANRGAYQGYFQDDELDNISWTRDVPASSYLSGLLTPRYSNMHFRPLGHGFFGLLARWADLNFPLYVAAIHVIHLANVLLLWLLLRRLKLPALAAGAGAVFFAFHMGVFDALWKPMYVFDLLCALFSLLALLAWTHRRWVLSFVAFWLACKSKELAVMLPAALAAYEFWLSEETGRRRWLRLAPFFAVSLIFGIQALAGRPEVNNVYRMDFSPAALAKTIPFYASRIFLVPYLGLALVALPWLARDRRVRFGLACLALFLVPLLILPGRMFGAYLYLPLAGVAVALAAVAARAPAWSVAAFFLIWLPWNYHHLRLERRAALTIAQANRAYVGELFRAAAGLAETRTFVYDLPPASMSKWGIEGALRYYFRQEVSAYYVDEPDLARVAAGKDLAFLSWDPAEKKILVVHWRAGELPVSYIRMNREAPVWQLVDGWHERSGSFRWTLPVARAVLARPAGARQFELTVNAGPPYLAAVKRGEVEVLLDGKPIGHAEFTREGWQTVRFDLDPAPAGVVKVEFRARPEIPTSPPGTPPLGLPVGDFGFAPPGGGRAR